MTEDEALAHLEAYGADLRRWPAELRAAGEQALAAFPALRAAQLREHAFDRRLGQPPELDDAQVARLIAAVGQAIRLRPRETLLLLLFGRMPVRLVGALCAATLALGWMAGSLTVHGRSGNDLAFVADDVFEAGGR
jgi:hypothetical protein